MAKIRVGIVEDELIIGESIADELRDMGYEPIGPAINYTEGLALIENEKPDIILLDIVLSGKKDGIDLAWEIKSNYNIPYIFLTSHADKITVERAKKVDPPAYLVKPFNADELYSAIEIALYNYSHKTRVASVPNTDGNKILMADALFIKNNQSYEKVLLSEILYLKSDHVYIDIVTMNKTFVVRSNMNEYLNKLPNYFFRTHRSYAVNLNYITTVNTTYMFIGEHKIPISKNKRLELLELLKIE